MCELGGMMEEGELAVFFRNNHFSTILKRQDHLLLLVTDHGFVNEHGHVWQTLSTTDGDESFMDARFRPSAVSEVQQEREKEGAESQDQTTPTRDPPPVSQDVDYQTALTLQQEEYRAAGEWRLITPTNPPHLNRFTQLWQDQIQLRNTREHHRLTDNTDQIHHAQSFNSQLYRVIVIIVTSHHNDNT
ncbi:Ubiquitin carboxyl-terminal hydrolase MINDY-1 [Geodia barretti]|uniref:Ubiquitin carboxyl-terminal hydrolase n=1 Tax=Geodia barretti TaxID=519541 RepID=A0AA35R9D5_GEOBA|nr:Ubiquitin carboxyl-terminal hydrolase MINDY-1 [Geodia barretti]